MNTEIVLWILGSSIGVLVVIIGALFKLIMSHINDCRALNVVLIRVDTNVARIMTDIGDNDRGIRAQIAALEQQVSEHRFRLGALDKLVNGT